MANEPQCQQSGTADEAQDSRYLRLTLGLVLGAIVGSTFYASVNARGLYHDGVYYLVRVAQSQWFHLTDPARTTVQILRQAPIVILSRFTPMTLFHRGQVLTFVMLALPTTLCALCWFISPRQRKAWILFPIAFLLIGFAPTSVHGIGEAAIASSYFWILLFLLFFRTRSVGSQALFLLLSLPAFRLHEGTFPLTAAILLGCAIRWRQAKAPLERLFVGLSALLFAAIFAYQIGWIISPHTPADQQAIAYGLLHFEFLYVDGHFNLPLVTGSVALLTLAILCAINLMSPPEQAATLTRVVVVAWILFALTAIAVAALSEASFSPFAQLQARYQPVFVGAALAILMAFLLAFNVPDRTWMRPATIVILLSLCAAQMAADIAATRRWNAFVVDLQSRLGSLHGLVPWESMLHTGNDERDTNWRLMAVEWTIPFTSIVFAPTSHIQSMIDLPVGMSYRPVDPEKPDSLPKLPGVDFSPYRQFFAQQKLGVRP